MRPSRRSALAAIGLMALVILPMAASPVFAGGNGNASEWARNKHLGFAAGPTGAVVDVAFSPAVQISVLDAAMRVRSGVNNVDVTLSLNRPAGNNATLAGCTLTARTVNGIATFTGCKLTGGTGGPFTLRATAASRNKGHTLDVTSRPFFVSATAPAPTPVPSPTPRPSATIPPVPTPTPVITVPSLVATSPITFGEQSLLTINFGPAGANKAYDLESSTDGAVWSKVVNATGLAANLAGSGAVRIAPARNTYYRAAMAGVAVTPAFKVVVRYAITLSPASADFSTTYPRQSRFELRGQVAPAPEGSPATVRFVIYRYVYGTWQVAAKQDVLTDMAGLAKMTWIASTRADYRVRAVALSSSLNGTSLWTPYSYFRVR